MTSAADAFEIDAYFYNGSCATDRRGMAASYLGSYQILGDAAAGRTKFDFFVTLPNLASNGAIALTATDVSTGNTSELGECMPADQIFRDRFQ